MTRREKILATVVVLLIAAALGMGVWMQRREHYVENVLRDFANLSHQAESLDPEGLPARRLKETQPQIQQLILRREYGEAREELDALQETTHTEQFSLLQLDRSLTVNQVLPPDSPERTRAQAAPRTQSSSKSLDSIVMTPCYPAFWRSRSGRRNLLAAFCGWQR